MFWHPYWHRGSWAGARIDLALLGDIEKIEEWRDITEETFRDLWKTWSVDRNCDESCSLCSIYRRMRLEEKEKKDQEGKGDRTDRSVSNLD
jgi:hypothetical protein